MINGGRPLRFLIAVMSGWVAGRAVMLWPVDPIAATRRMLLPHASAEIAAPVRATHRQVVPLMDRLHVVAAPTGLRMASAPPPTDGATLSAETIAAPVEPIVRPGIVAGLPVAISPSTSPSIRRSRLFGSVWAVVRGGSGPAGGVPGVQLGGSQAGLRLGYALRDDRRLALVGRLSSPLGPGMREAALGVEWQPTRLPLRLVAEHRIALGAGRGGPTLAAVGGIGPVPLAAGFALEAYAQGGVIARDGAEGFADGALRIARPVTTLGGVRIEIGGGTWGAAQRGATRLDVGPSLSAVLPLGPQPVRLSLDWRQRAAGNAAPGTGLVVTLGADF